MKGAPGIFEEVKKIHVAAHKAGVYVDVAWESRATEAMRIADLFSRKEDSSQIFTTFQTLKTIIGALGSPPLWKYLPARTCQNTWHHCSIPNTQIADPTEQMLSAKSGG